MGSHRTGGCTAEVAHRDGHAVVVVRGEVDIATAEEFGRAVELVSQQCCRIEVDLRDTTFMDAAGLAVLLNAYRRLGRAHEAIVVHDPPPLILTLFEITGVAALFDIRLDIDPDEALKAFTACDLGRRVERPSRSGTSRFGGTTSNRSSHDEQESVS